MRSLELTMAASMPGCSPVRPAMSNLSGPVIGGINSEGVRKSKANAPSGEVVMLVVSDPTTTAPCFGVDSLTEKLPPDSPQNPTVGGAHCTRAYLICPPRSSPRFSSGVPSSQSRGFFDVADSTALVQPLGLSPARAAEGQADRATRRNAAAWEKPVATRARGEMIGEIAFMPRTVSSYIAVVKGFLRL